MHVPPFNQLKPLRVSGLYGLLSSDLACYILEFLNVAELNRIACVCRTFTEVCAPPADTHPYVRQFPRPQPPTHARAHLSAPACALLCWPPPAALACLSDLPPPLLSRQLKATVVLGNSRLALRYAAAAQPRFASAPHGLLPPPSPRDRAHGTLAAECGGPFTAQTHAATLARPCEAASASGAGSSSGGAPPPFGSSVIYDGRGMARVAPQPI